MCNFEELPLSDDEVGVLRESQGGEETSTLAARLILQWGFSPALRYSVDTLISTPTGLGKTHIFSTHPWTRFPDVTGNQPVIHISQTRDARDNAVEESEDSSVDYKVLRAREEACPVAAGNHDTEVNTPNGLDASDWFDQKCDKEQIQFSEAHNYLDQYTDGLPCNRGEGCDSLSQWDDVPRGDDGNPTYDIIHATAPFAKIPQLTENANIIFDERPNYQVDFDQEHVRQAINTVLERRTGGGRFTWARLMELTKDSPTTSLATVGLSNPSELEDEHIEYIRLLEAEIEDPFDFERGENLHTLAPKIGFAILNGVQVGNERFSGTRSDVTVVFYTHNSIKCIFEEPNLSEAKAVIGLDAHPTKKLWELNLGLTLDYQRILNSQEERYWRTQERCLFVVQVGNNTNPLTTAWRDGGRQKAQVRAILREMHEKFGEEYHTAIVPKRIKDQVESMMVDVGIDNPELLHYGEERSLNRFEGETTGLLLGCIDPGDGYVLDMLAAQGEYAEPQMAEAENGDEYRAYGRNFVGQDAESAEEYLKSVREEHIAQSIGHYARNPHEEEDTIAIVFVWTDAIPDSLVDVQVSGVESQLTEEGELTESMREIDRFVREHDGPVTKRMVVDAIDVSGPHALDVLGKMDEQEVVERSEGTGRYGADEFHHQSGSLGPTVNLSLQ